MIQEQEASGWSTASSTAGKSICKAPDSPNRIPSLWILIWHDGVRGNIFGWGCVSKCRTKISYIQNSKSMVQMECYGIYIRSIWLDRIDYQIIIGNFHDVYCGERKHWIKVESSNYKEFCLWMNFLPVTDHFILHREISIYIYIHIYI